MFAFGHQLSIPFAESYRCLPAYGLDGFGKVLQAQWQVTTDVGRLTIRPDAFDQGPTRLGIVGLGHATLLVDGNQSCEIGPHGHTIRLL